MFAGYKNMEEDVMDSNMNLGTGSKTKNSKEKKIKGCKREKGR